MHYGLTNTPLQTTNECLVMGIFADAIVPEYALTLNTEHHGLITQLIEKTPKFKDSAWQSVLGNKSLLIIQCGKKEEFDNIQLKKIMHELTAELIKQRIKSATIALPAVVNQDSDKQLEQMIVEIDHQSYQLLDFKIKNKNPHALTHVDIYLPQAHEKALTTAAAICSGIELTRDLANKPANICTPTYLGEQALVLAQESNQIQCQVLGLEAIRELGMNGFLAVAQGSAEPPRFIELMYQGDGDAAPIVLVGKGVTFDSGGLCIKPANLMDEMKYDMSGAASVLGVLKTCALLKLKLNIVGLIGCAENLPSSTAMKGGDIITTMSGQTVEILNTDAEGRLILADALTYAERFNPQFVIDIATLTGAIIVALGTNTTGLMTTDDELAKLIEQAACESNDRVWRLPLDATYQDALHSTLADMINAGFDRIAGSVTAACFLSRYTEKFRWAHLDIAGTAWISGKNRNATGRPVPLLIQLLRNVSGC